MNRCRFYTSAESCHDWGGNKVNNADDEKESEPHPQPGDELIIHGNLFAKTRPYKALHAFLVEESQTAKPLAKSTKM